MVTLCIYIVYPLSRDYKLKLIELLWCALGPLYKLVSMLSYNDRDLLALQQRDGVEGLDTHNLQITWTPANRVCASYYISTGGLNLSRHQWEDTTHSRKVALLLGLVQLIVDMKNCSEGNLGSFYVKYFTGLFSKHYKLHHPRAGPL